MLVSTIRRILFGGAGIFLFVQAFQSFRLAGWTGDTVMAGVIGGLFALMAITGKGG